MNKLVAILLLLGSTSAALAQSGSLPPGTLPPNYKTILTGHSFRVIRVHYGPHEKVPVHDHPAVDTVYVYLNDSSPVRITHEYDDKPSSAIVRPPTKTGAFRISPGQVERHSVENLGDIESDFFRVELLNTHLDKTFEFRGPAPADTTHNLSATEFTSPELTVARTICIQPEPCTIAASPMSSVAIAISPSTITHNGHPTTLQHGDFIAVPAGQSATISPTGQNPAHILQVLVR